MEEKNINCCIRDIFMLDEKTIPPTLSKHLTNNIFIKPNKEAMEQVLYHLLPLTDPNCLKTIPWPISTFKEAAEFRTAATRIINNLNGFVYEKSSNVISKVNSSLLANPGGRIFISFMYQLCSYIMCCELKKKGIDVLNRPLYMVDEYIDKKISMFNAISESNFNEVNEIISRIEYNLENTTESAIKWKEIIQDSKQCIKDFKSELLNIEHCEVTENEVVELKQKYINLYENFEQNTLIPMKCARLADIILKAQENWDANKIQLIYNINKYESIEDGKVDLVKLLTTIKNTLNDSINYCEQLNNEGEINNMILKTEQLVIDRTKQMQSYEENIKIKCNLIDELKVKNEKLELEVFTSENIKNNDSKLQLVYQRILPIVLKTDFTDELKSTISEESKNARRSILLHCHAPYEYQEISFDKIKEVYRALLNQNEVINQDVMNKTNNEHSFKLNESIQSTQVILLKNNYNGNSQGDTFGTHKNQLLSTTHLTESDETDNLNKSLHIQIKEDEVNSVSISRKSIENIKKKFNQIKKQAMSTIPHSPLSPESPYF